MNLHDAAHLHELAFFASLLPCSPTQMHMQISMHIFMILHLLPSTECTAAHLHNIVRHLEFSTPVLLFINLPSQVLCCLIVPAKLHNYVILYLKFSTHVHFFMDLPSRFVCYLAAPAQLQTYITLYTSLNSANTCSSSWTCLPNFSAASQRLQRGRHSALPRLRHLQAQEQKGDERGMEEGGLDRNGQGCRETGEEALGAGAKGG